MGSAVICDRCGRTEIETAEEFGPKSTGQRPLMFAGSDHVVRWLCMQCWGLLAVWLEGGAAPACPDRRGAAEHSQRIKDAVKSGKPKHLQGMFELNKP